MLLLSAPNNRQVLWLLPYDSVFMRGFGCLLKLENEGPESRSTVLLGDRDGVDGQSRSRIMMY